MSDISSGTYEGATGEMVDSLRDEYLSDLADDLQAFDQPIAEAAADPERAKEITLRLRQLAFDTKGQAHNFGLTLIHAIAHRMDDYLASVDVLGEAGLADARTFIEVISDVVSGDISAVTEPSALVRRLPARPSMDTAAIETRETEILLVMLHGAATKKVQRELQECGYRVNVVTSTCEALPLILRTKPDLVVVSAVMTEISGIDLTVAMKAMPVTRNVPIALITSFGRDHDDLHYLPEGVPVIQKGQNFPDDIAAALEFHFLI